VPLQQEADLAKAARDPLSRIAVLREGLHKKPKELARGEDLAEHQQGGVQVPVHLLRRGGVGGEPDVVHHGRNDDARLVVG